MEGTRRRPRDVYDEIVDEYISGVPSKYFRLEKGRLAPVQPFPVTDPSMLPPHQRPKGAASASASAPMAALQEIGTSSTFYKPPTAPIPTPTPPKDEEGCSLRGVPSEMDLWALINEPYDTWSQPSKCTKITPEGESMWCGHCAERKKKKCIGTIHPIVLPARKPNCFIQKEGAVAFVYAAETIERGQELTANYNWWEQRPGQEAKVPPRQLAPCPPEPVGDPMTSQTHPCVQDRIMLYKCKAFRNKAKQGGGRNGLTIKPKQSIGHGIMAGSQIPKGAKIMLVTGVFVHEDSIRHPFTPCIFNYAHRVSDEPPIAVLPRMQPTVGAAAGGEVGGGVIEERYYRIPQTVETVDGSPQKRTEKVYRKMITG